MDPDRWARVKELFHAALECEPGGRPRFVRDACAGDEALRQAVEAMLARETEARSFLESPAIPAGQPSRLTAGGGALSCAPTAAPPMALAPGTRLGPYEIVAALGAGGMGEVYLAQDTSLDRKVAIKVLAGTFRDDDTAKKRLLREARLAAALDHPYICGIHELLEVDDTNFIVMEYIEGQTLRERLAGGALRPQDVLRVGLEVAEALEKAHLKGIIHRDLKPANIMLTPEGHVKVMDFGLAKQSAQAEVPSQEETVSRLTQAGTTVGTLAYMSPEQIRGEVLTSQSDLFSLGVVLYELLTGAHPFKKNLGTDTAHAILHDTPAPISSRPEAVAPELQRLLDAMLAKRPSERGSVHEIRSQLAHLVEQGAAEPPPLARMFLVRLRQAWARPYVALSRKLALLLSALAVLSAVAVLLPNLIRDRKAPAIAKIENSIAVISFENQTGDKSYDYLQKAIPSLLITSFEQRGGVYVPTWERLRDLLKQIGRGAEDAIGADVGFELCRREGIQALVLGSYVKAGDMFALDAKVLDVETKRLLRSANSRGKGIDSILESQIDELSAEVLKGIGQAASEPGFAPAKVANVTTSSMEAYSDFLGGDEALDHLDLENARRFLTRAVETDPTFAMAHSYLSFTFGLLGESEAERREMELAREYAHRATEKERLYIEADALNLANDRVGYLKRIEELTRKYPREKQFQLDLGVALLATDPPRAIEAITKALELDPEFGAALAYLGLIHRKSGDYAKALAFERRYAARYPGEADPPDAMAWTYLRMGDLDQAVAKHKEALEDHPDYFWSNKGMFYVSALKQDYPQAKEWADRLVSISKSPGDVIEALWCRALLERWLGRFKAAQETIREAGEVADRYSNKELRAVTDFIKGCVHLDRGELEQGRRCLQDSWDYETGTHGLETPERKVIVGYALVLSELQGGRIDRAKARWADIKGYLVRPASALAWDMALTHDLLSVEIQLQEGPVQIPASVVERARGQKPPVTFAGPYLVPYNLLPLRDVLARAYQRNGEIDKAIAEYERLTTLGPDNPSRALVDPLIYYRLGKLHEQKKATVKASENYRRFLDLWKDADPGRPEVEDARKRLAGLNGR